MAQNHKNAWLELRTFLKSATSITGFDELDYLTQRLLEWIVIYSAECNVIYIQTVIMKSGVASPATLFKNLDLLEYTGFIDISVDKLDSRRRIISLTPKATKLFKKLDALTARFCVTIS